MRIVYGVFGYGRGHASRALGLLPELTKRHEVMVLGGGDAYATLAPHYPVVEIPTLHFVYGQEGRRSHLGTIRENGPKVWDLLRGGPRFRELVEAVRRFEPDVAISDADPWTHRAAAALKIPRISMDHFGVLAYARPPIPPEDRVRMAGDVLIYRKLMGRAARIIVSSFFPVKAVDPRVHVVGPLLRDEVRTAQPFRGEHLLVYFNNGKTQLTPTIEAALKHARLPMRIHGTGRSGRDGLLDYRPQNDAEFLEDLVGCRAILSTAGNQLVGEAMALGKPLLVKPEDSVEQRLNGASVARLGIGEKVRHADLSPRIIHRFLEREGEYRATALSLSRDGRAETLAALTRYAGELHESRRLLPAATWGLA